VVGDAWCLSEKEKTLKKVEKVENVKRKPRIEVGRKLR